MARTGRSIAIILAGGAAGLGIARNWGRIRGGVKQLAPSIGASSQDQPSKVVAEGDDTGLGIVASNAGAASASKTEPVQSETSQGGPQHVEDEVLDQRTRPEGGTLPEDSARMSQEESAPPNEGVGWVRVKDAQGCPSGHPIKGNASSRIYHMPGQPHYERTKPEICFVDELAATAMGYRPSNAGGNGQTNA